MLSGACPVVASYGAQDRTFKGAAAELERVLTAAGVDARRQGVPRRRALVHEPGNAGPLSALMRVAGVGYHGPSSEDAWARILRFFDQHLRDSPVSS